MNHITMESLSSYFTGEIGLLEKAELFLHAESCNECRALLQAGQRIRRTLSMIRAEQSFLKKAEASPYLAVASSGGMSAARPDKAGSLSVMLSDGTMPVFRPETLCAEGEGEMFALNPAMEGRSFVDDGGRLTLRIAGDRLIVQLRDDDYGGLVRLTGAGETGAWQQIENGQIELSLPAGTDRRLEILLIG